MHQPESAPAPDAPSSPAAGAIAPVPVGAGKAQVTIDDFLKLDLRVATVKQCQPHPNADKLLVLQLDDGSPEGRQICAGLREMYDPEQLVGQQLVIVANLAPRTIRGEVSQGMLLAASSADRAQVVVIAPTTRIAPGSSVG